MSQHAASAKNANKIVKIFLAYLNQFILLCSAILLTILLIYFFHINIINPLAELIKHQILAEHFDNKEVPLRGTFRQIQ